MISTSIAPSFSYSLKAARTACSTSGARPGPKYSRGTPIRKPLMSPVKPTLKSSAGRSMLVESRSSKPAMAFSSSAQSSAVLAIGPP